MRPDFFFAGGLYNVDGSQGLATVEDLEANGAKVFFMTCTENSQAEPGAKPTIEVVYSRIEDLEKIFGVPDRASALVARMKADIAAVQQRIQGRPALRVFVFAGDYNGASRASTSPWVCAMFARSAKPHEVSFEIAEGETLALVGHSGAGKSTCANLLLRLWDTTSGRVTIGGADVRTMPLAQLPELIAYVPRTSTCSTATSWTTSGSDAPQPPTTTSTRPPRSPRRPSSSKHCPAGTTPNSASAAPPLRRATPATGHRQRLAIARAVLSTAPILVMDEAVSSLDTESEAAIHQAITDLGGQRTMLIIAHRPSTIRTADRIIVLSDGHVVDNGTYTQLLTTNGPFATLVRQGLDKLD